LEFDLWAWRIAIPIVAVFAATAGIICRNQLFRTRHVA
jgi:hypothetical protein